ncbi:MAG: insulinase family protein [Ignavibacteriales bacterium]|nr:insulinase family protein [Ignavibacteriales bacterium]
MVETSSHKLHATYQKSVLPNGLRVVSEEIPHVRSTSVGVWIDTGSRDEGPGNNGISHFIEHMVFKGTKKRNTREIAQSIESVGGYLNAFTSKEHTCYYARVLDEYTELALDVLSDITLNPAFPQKELEKEKGVVIEELKNAEDDPDDIIHDYLEKALYGEHSLGFPVIGTEQNLRVFRRSDLSQHRSSHYQPSRMVIAAAGNLRHHQLVEMAQRYFPLGSGKTGSVHMRRRPAGKSGIEKTVEKPIQQAHLCLGTVTFSIKDKQRYPLMVLNTLLGDGMSSRLFQNIREKYGFAYTVYSFANLLSDAGSFGVYVGTDAPHVGQCEELIWKELEALAAKPVSMGELNRTKAQLKGSMMLSLESISNRMIRLGSSELYFHQLHSLDNVVSQINNVTREDVLAVAKGVFRRDWFSKIVFKPTEQRSSTEGNGSVGRN